MRLSDRPPTLDEVRITEMRLARLSVLQELTVAALELTNPATSVDDFLQHVSERMGCVAAFWLGIRDARVTLFAAAGISRQARALPIALCSEGLRAVVLPFPELSGSDLDCWRFALPDIEAQEQTLHLYFARPGHGPSPDLQAMARRVATLFQSAIVHRQLYQDLQRSYHQLEKAQQTLVARERLAALGEMAAVVAHEVRNPLGAIFNSLATLKKIVPDLDNAAPLLFIVEEEASRVSRIIMDLLEFAKPGGVKLHDSPIDEVIRVTVDAARAARVVPDDVDLQVRVDDELPTILLDGRLMRQALLNLLANAFQVSPRPGSVRVHAFARLGEQGALCIAISDEGSGVDTDARGRIFEPFFTTKGAGTGLGLTIVKRIAEAHHGHVEVTSNPASGATFTMVLPLDPLSGD